MLLRRRIGKQSQGCSATVGKVISSVQGDPLGSQYTPVCAHNQLEGQVYAKALVQPYQIKTHHKQSTSHADHNLEQTHPARARACNYGGPYLQDVTEH